MCAPSPSAAPSDPRTPFGSFPTDFFPFFTYDAPRFEYPNEKNRIRETERENTLLEYVKTKGSKLKSTGTSLIF